jgi:hypothetical protein
MFLSKDHEQLSAISSPLHRKKECFDMTPVQQAVHSHVILWNAMDRESWIHSFKPGRRWTLHPEQVVAAGNEAAVVMRNEGDLAGEKVTIRSIEIFIVDESGLLVRIRSFFDQPSDFALSDYFTPQRTE